MSYNAIIEKVFLDRYRPRDPEVGFVRDDLIAAAQDLGVAVPRNLGDVLYTFRYRRPLPKAVLETAPPDKEWTIRGASQAAYTFRLVGVNRVVPNHALMTINIPDATPEIVSAHAMSDEQALLAKIRYNRLLDVFLGVSAYSLQNHLRTTVKRIGQIEVDEIYVAVDSTGRQFVPVQAKGGSDQLSVVQSEQDLLWCRERLADLICRTILTQFAEDDLIAMFESPWKATRSRSCRRSTTDSSRRRRSPPRTCCAIATQLGRPVSSSAPVVASSDRSVQQLLFCLAPPPSEPVAACNRSTASG